MRFQEGLSASIGARKPKRDQRGTASACTRSKCRHRCQLITAEVPPTGAASNKTVSRGARWPAPSQCRAQGITTSVGGKSPRRHPVGLHRPRGDRRTGSDGLAEGCRQSSRQRRHAGELDDPGGIPGTSGVPGASRCACPDLRGRQVRTYKLQRRRNKTRRPQAGSRHLPELRSLLRRIPHDAVGLHRAGQRQPRGTLSFLVNR